MNEKHFTIIIIYPLSARVVGPPQMISQPVSSIFPVLHCPLGLSELRACPFPDVVFPPLPLSALQCNLLCLLMYNHHLIIYLLTARVVGAPQIILQPVSEIFPVLHCPLGPAELRACPFPDVVFPPFPLSALSSSPFHCASQDGSGQA